MSQKILENILKKSESKDFFEFIDNLTISEFQSYMLEVFRRKTSIIEPAQLFDAYDQNRFVSPSDLKPEELLAFDQLAFSMLPEGFQSIELSPVAPIGNYSSLATIDQNNVISALRGVETVADSTNLMALECTKQRRALLLEDPKSTQLVNFASSHRLIRAQKFDFEKFSPHFKVFSMCTAGRDMGSLKFEIDSLIEHISYYLDLIKVIVNTETVTNITVKLTDFSKKHNQYLIEKIADPIKEKHSEIHFMVDNNRDTGKNYYDNICFHININNKNGVAIDYVDGGFTNWTQKILSNKKERLLISAIGSELILKTCTTI